MMGQNIIINKTIQKILQRQARPIFSDYVYKKSQNLKLLDKIETSLSKY